MIRKYPSFSTPRRIRFARSFLCVGHMLFAGLLLLLPSNSLLAQQKTNSQQETTSSKAEAEFDRGRVLVSQGKTKEGLELIQGLEKAENLKIDFRRNIRLAHLSTLSTIGKKARSEEDWKTLLKISQQLLALVGKTQKEDFGDDERFAQVIQARRYWSYKDHVLAYQGIGNFEKAKEYSKKLYQGDDQNELPDGLKKSFNFDFFQEPGFNVWGYEYYPKLADAPAGSSFSKVVYLVYKAKVDGTDGEPVFRLHILRLHKISKDDKGDYVMSLKSEKFAGKTLYKFIYDEPIDIEQVRKDIRTVCKSICGQLKKQESKKPKDKGQDESK